MSEMASVDFGQCEALGFSVDFRHSKLDNCSFRKRKMSGTPFSKSVLNDCFFTESDLTGASFDDCSLPGTVFDRCTLKGADFRSASEFAIDPAQNNLRKAKFSTYNLAGLLSGYGIVIE